MVRNVRAGGSRQGGSTLTQQLARTLFLSNRKSYGRKAREAVIAFLIEAQLSKQQILELYLNRIFLGAGIYGVEAMSQRVFGKPAKSLTLAESALIAGLARAPAALSPWSNLDEARARSHVVLARMRDEGFITDAEYRAALQAPLRVRPYRSDSDSRHGYAKAYLRQRFRDEFGGDHPPDWRVQTTFVAELQDAAEAAVREGTAAHRASRSCRRRWSRSIRRPATSSPSWAAATISSPRSIAPAAAGVSPDPPSSHLSLPRHSNAACRRSRR